MLCGVESAAMRHARSPIVAILLVAILVLSGCSSDDSPTDPGEPLIIYVAMGASDALGVGASPLTNGYVFLIAQDLDMDHRVDLRNLGELGAHSFELVARQLPSALSADPDVVTIWTGSNDVIGGDGVASFAADLDRMLGDLAAQTNAEVFVGDLVDLTRIPRFILDPDPNVTPARVSAFNAAINNAAATHGAHVVPLSSLPLTPDLFSIDGFHPSNEGHRQIANVFLDAIRSRL